MDRGKDAESEGGKDEEEKKYEKGPVFESVRAIFVGDLEELGMVIDGL